MQQTDVYNKEPEEAMRKVKLIIFYLLLLNHIGKYIYNHGK